MNPSTPNVRRLGSQGLQTFAIGLGCMGGNCRRRALPRSRDEVGQSLKPVAGGLKRAAGSLAVLGLQLLYRPR